MCNCKYCGIDLLENHMLELNEVTLMKNDVKIITPLCSKCGNRIEISDVSQNIKGNQKVVLLSGTCASGKSTIGKYVELNYDYVFIDGDAISKRLNYDIKKGIVKERTEYLCHQEVINTMLIVMGLGYSLFVTYVFNVIDLERYKMVLKQYGIIPEFRVLLPSREECILRDINRSCWTAGEEFIDKWYDSQCEYRDIMPENCIDNTFETVEETVQNHLSQIL